VKNKIREIELLAPAKNLHLGMEAVNAGADAVYIGPEKFGARLAAGNAITDIEKLVKYAHKFSVKVFATVNTILFDGELNKAENLIWDLYNCGVDAIIFQDLALLAMHLPPIELHASTQTNNFELERIKFFDSLGIDRIILARELSLTQIRDIKAQVSAELEFFVHGALCVSLSGQCYLSQAITGRSANRGECSQPCRSKYNLLDESGELLIKNKHLLSLKDLNLSEYISDLIDSGINSFKIEGRLKNLEYVKNVTAFYRQKIDEVILNRNDLKRASIGESDINFTSDLGKSFSRGFTNYFIENKREKLSTFNTAKSIGEDLGEVKFIRKNYFRLQQSDIIVNNGDGLCFFNSNDELEGFLVNDVKNGMIKFPKDCDIRKKTHIYRNYDKRFTDELRNNIFRKIYFDLKIFQTEKYICFEVIAENNVKCDIKILNEFDETKEKSKYESILIKAFSKTGNTIFKLKNVKNEMNKLLFIPISKLNLIRRELLKKLEDELGNSFVRKQPKEKLLRNYYTDTVDFSHNISNKLAEKIMTDLAVKVTEYSPEITKNYYNKPLMICKYCVRKEMDICSQKTKENTKLYLENNGIRYLLEFDCKKCQMKIFKV